MHGLAYIKDEINTFVVNNCGNDKTEAQGMYGLVYAK